MPDPIVPDAQPAASSAAADPAPVRDALEMLSEDQLQDWRLTGAMPGDSPVTTATAASSAAPAVQDLPASTDAPAEPVSETGTPRPDPRATENRVPELLADRKRERDRAERAERRLAELEQQHQPAPDARRADPSPAAAGLVAPDPDQFPYGTADPGYLQALTNHTVATTLERERQTWEQRQQEATRHQDFLRTKEAFDARTAQARLTHPDFDAVALLAPTEIPQGSAADLWVLEDEAGAEILYHLQQPAQANERRRILNLGPREQLKELVRLGDRLTAANPPARSTNAPPPPPTLLTRPTPGDPVERALAEGDSDSATGAYMAAKNAEDMRRLKR